MEYLGVSKMAEKWGLSASRVRALCAEGKIEDVVKKSGFYSIPANAIKPEKIIKKYNRNNIMKTADYSKVVCQHTDILNVENLGIKALDNLKNIDITFNQQTSLLPIDGSLLVSNSHESVLSSLLSNVLKICDNIASLLGSLDVIAITEKITEAMIPISYINLLERLGWPIFFIDNTQLRNDILEVCKYNDNLNLVSEIIFDYFTKEYITIMEKDWLDCPVLKEDRKPILSQIIYTHNQGLYYASTSTAMCQIFGIASDIENLLTNNDMTLNNEEKEYLSEILNLDLKYINKEKGRLFQITMFTKSGAHLWIAMVNYLKNICLCSDVDYSKKIQHPLRNKICHGEQLHYGTKEHSLKALMIIDMLVQLAYEINRVIEFKNRDIK